MVFYLFCNKIEGNVVTKHIIPAPDLHNKSDKSPRICAYFFTIRPNLPILFHALSASETQKNRFTQKEACTANRCTNLPHTNTWLSIAKRTTSSSICSFSNLAPYNKLLTVNEFNTLGQPCARNTIASNAAAVKIGNFAPATSR